eukprot:14884310-Alexandrium_andersonii.AAC.1
MEGVHCMASPYEMFAFLHKSLPGVFAKRFLGLPTLDGASARLRSFWSAVPDIDPRKQQVATALLARADIEDLDDAWGRAVPLVIHGDGVPVGRMSLDALS